MRIHKGARPQNAAMHPDARAALKKAMTTPAALQPNDVVALRRHDPELAEAAIARWRSVRSPSSIGPKDLVLLRKHFGQSAADDAMTRWRQDRGLGIRIDTRRK